MGSLAAQVETVHIDSLIGLFRWIKWFNVGLLSLAVVVPIDVLSAMESTRRS